MEGRHSDEAKAEDDRIAGQREELSEKQQQPEEDGIESAGPESMRSRKLKKKTTGPPTQEMIKHIRSGHARVKELKTRQRMER